MDKLAFKIDGTVSYSRQPSAEELKQLVEQEGYKSVLNLRDASEDDFLHEEPQIAEREGIQHANIPVKNISSFSEEKMENISQAIESLPKPVIVHCHHGQRAAIASLLYLARKNNQKPEDVFDAGKQFGFDFQANQTLSEFIHHYVSPK